MTTLNFTPSFTQNFIAKSKAFVSLVLCHKCHFSSQLQLEKKNKFLSEGEKLNFKVFKHNKTIVFKQVGFSSTIF